GHVAGDQLIRRCAEVLRSGLRQYDKLYRWGGDEFLIVLPSARATDVLERLHLAIAGADPVRSLASGQTITLHVSLGASDYSSSAELTAAIERADNAMYQEKNRHKSDPVYGLLDAESRRAPTPVAH